MATPATSVQRSSRALASKKIVVIGGGTGSFTILSGLKRYPAHLSAVVTMTDSGGSSGRLRDEFGILPPGDLRQCLLALTPDDYARATLKSLLEYRFKSGNGLSGHSFGNLFLTALINLTGRTDKAVDELGRLLGIQGRVLPVTLTNTNLCARLKNGKTVVGEAHLDIRTSDPDVPIDYVYLQHKAKVLRETAKALEEADLIVIGPGDLYTSIVPNLLVAGVPQAIQRSKAKTVYICNLVTKHGETDGFTASRYIREIQRYLGNHGALDAVLVNTTPLPKALIPRYAAEKSYPVAFDRAACQALVPSVVARPLLTATKVVRHDSRALAKAVIGLL
jgi:uncharacterized cofD-like protein